jgi:hypothetical protein
VRYIREAAKLGDRLVVILNGDDFLLRKKGFVFRPFEDRKEILENIKGVDEVIASVDEDQTVRKTLKLVKPDIFAKGGSRTGPENIPEADTCRKYVLPKLIEAGWDNDPRSFTEQRTFTDGRIVVSGEKIYRRPQKRADYLLRHTRDFPIAVIEAKAEFQKFLDLHPKHQSAGHHPHLPVSTRTLSLVVY